MLNQLKAADRLLLLRFVCAFAWADLQVTERERTFVKRLVDRLSLSPDEAAQVDSWLAVAPSPQSVDPSQVPSEHRRAFVETIRALIFVDGSVDPDERKSFDQLKAALDV
jgi:uncharacterized tellurite resistance protein B-like protein